ncbi:MAG TPA: hypothetical protein PLN53_14755 [Terricaulis sp.]|mgnify:FL=1|nr:hypothetical protein [Terricaulis sp.]
MGFLLTFLRSGFAGLWRIANFWRISPLEGVRTGSPLAGALLFLFLVFFVIGIVLVSLGFDLNEVDRWLDAQGGWLDFLGRVIIRIILVFVLLMCVAIAATMLFARGAEGAPGWLATIGALLLCLLVGYCSAVNIAAPL